MTRRLLASLATAAGTALLIIFVALFSGGSTSAQQPQGSLPMGAPRQPLAAWADIATFPAMVVSPTPGTSPLRLKRVGAAAYFPNGKLYVLGGRHGVDGEDVAMRNIWEYTPGSPSSWLAKTSLLDNAQQGNIYTSNMATAVLTDANGVRIYAVGGVSIDSAVTDTVRIYDPIADSLSRAASDPWPANPQRIPGGWAVVNNKLYIFGGFSDLANGGTGGVFTDTWRFDPMAPAGTRWTQLATANLNLGRAYIAGAALDGKIYAIGGDIWQGTPRQLVPVTNVEMMDPSQPNPTWTAVASLPTARGDMGAWSYDTGSPYEISGKIVVEGGHFDIPDSQGYIYTRFTNSWATFPNMVHATRNYGFAQLNGFLYAFGGYDYTNNLPSGANWNQRYDANANLLVGHVTWQGPPAQPNVLQQQPITLSLKLNTTVTNYPSQLTNSNGNFTANVSTLPSSTYTWWVKGPKYLANSGTVVLAGAPVTNVEMGTLRVGDSDNSNTVDAIDFGLLRNSFGKSLGQPGYDDRADFDANQVVDLTDFGLLKGNFGQAGPPQLTQPK